LFVATLYNGPAGTEMPCSPHPHPLRISISVMAITVSGAAMP
jgi:hypothetical protein